MGFVQLSTKFPFEQTQQFAARDEFDQSAGASAGKTAPIGGVWAGAGDATDADVVAVFAILQRTAVSDSTMAGRILTVGSSTYTSVVVQTEIWFSTILGAGASPEQGVIAQYVSTNDYVEAVATTYFDATAGRNFTRIEVRKVTATGAGSKSWTNIARLFVPTMTPGRWYSIRLHIGTIGRWAVWVWDTAAEAPGDPVAIGHSPVLATAGKIGLVDNHTDAAAVTRNQNNFLAFVPINDAAMFASQSLELRHDSAKRENAAGTVSNDIAVRRGPYLRVPPGGPDGRTVRVVVKGHRNDPVTMPDTGIDDITAQLFVTPRGTVVPE